MLRTLPLTLLLAACGGAAPLPAAPEAAGPEPVAAAPEAAAPPGLAIGALTEDELEMGCSCTFEFAPGGPAAGFALSGEVDESRFRARVGGEVVTLEQSAPGTWAAGELRMTLVTTSTTPCPPESEECEATGSTRDVTLTRGDQSARFAIVGACGC
jgi:hypothetical protein